ncbi:MAG: hypothetical protein IT290_10885 [Deltaproteobacteria bacterium]|nr:hypothetical protein [Deltaproteobacteria bacterium]
MKKKFLLSICASLVVLLTACSKRYDNLPAFTSIHFNDSFNYSVGRFKTSYLADQIHAYYRGNTSAPIAIATFVDLDNLYGSSTFGRILSEQLMSELAMKGYNVIELRHSDALQVLFDQGEFNLSREVGRIRKHQDISGIVVGTYVASPLRVYLNARLIDPATSMILSAGSVEMAKTEEISRMLRTNNYPPALERIPVKALGTAPYPIPYYWPYPPLNRPGRGGLFEDEESIYPSAPKGNGTTDLPVPSLKSSVSDKLQPTT